jgi:hypothetical protein
VPLEATERDVRETLEADKDIDRNGAIPHTKVMADARAVIERHAAKRRQKSLEWARAANDPVQSLHLQSWIGITSASTLLVFRIHKRVRVSFSGGVIPNSRRLSFREPANELALRWGPLRVVWVSESCETER